VLPSFLPLYIIVWPYSLVVYVIGLGVLPYLFVYEQATEGVHPFSVVEKKALPGGLYPDLLTNL